MKRELISLEPIENKIFVIRGQKVMIDRDLAQLYGVETKYLNRQVKRNTKRFPDEFMFQLTPDEKRELVTNWHRFKTMRHSTVLPYAFTEHGVAMLASVLNSERAINMSILIVKTFIKIREIFFNSKELENRLNMLERKIENHGFKIHLVSDAIRKLMQLPNKKKKKIGFLAGKN